MSELLVKNREVAVPGQVLAKGFDYLPGQGAYRLGEDLLASKVGLVSISGRAIKLINLAGAYIPKPNDVVICKVIDITMKGWRLDTHTAYSCMLGIQDVEGYIPDDADLTTILGLGDWVAVNIKKVTSQFIIDVTMYGPGLRKLSAGRVFNVNPMKVPRIIGKQGSMISMIKEHTGCKIVVGQNGVVWLRGLPEAEIIAVDAINLICDLAHTPGLTERVKEKLETECKDLDLSAMEDMEEEEEQMPRFERRERSDRRGGHRGGGGYRGGGNRGGGRPRYNNGGGRGGPRRNFEGRRDNRR